MSAVSKPQARLIPRSELIAALDGISPQTIWRYQKQGMPHLPMAGGEVYYNLEQVRTWMAANGIDGKQGRPTTAQAELKEQLQEAKLRKENILIEKHEHLLGLAKGRVFRRDEVEAGLTSRVAQVRGALLAVPGKLAQRLANRDALSIQRELEDEMRAILDSFAKGSAEAIPANPEAPPSSISAALDVTRPASDETKTMKEVRDA